MNALKSVLAILGITIATTAFADEGHIKVASSSSSGTYDKMLGEIIGVCSSETFAIEPVKDVTGGAPGNLEALVNNKAQAAFMHADVFSQSSQADPSYKRFQTLVALYPEPIHIVALKKSKTAEDGTLGKAKAFFSGNQEFNSLVDLKGFSVGAAGGGVYTARVLTGQGEGGFHVVSYDSGDKVIDALNKGEIAAAIFVGAAPLPNLEKLNKATYKIIPVGEAIASKVSGVYRPVTVSYQGLTNGPVKTLAPLAVIMTRKYSTPVMIAAQRNFRECFNTHLGELQDTGSPNWQQVIAGDHGVLDWYEIPSSPAKIASRKK